METLLAALGAVLVFLAAFDLFITVLTTRGGGPISSRLGSACWRVVLALHRGRGSHKTIGYAGAVIALLTILVWIVLFWAGWLLIFSAVAESVVRATTGEAADIWARVYYSGYTFFTLGLGDYRPDGALWQVLTALAVGNGFLVISLSGSYLIPLVSAATSKRSVALQIDGLGSTPEEILKFAWDGNGFSGLALHLVSLSSAITQASQQHLAYPVLHYFQSTDSKAALPVQIARLSEALELLERAVDPQHRLPETVTRAARQSIQNYVDVIKPSPPWSDDEELPPEPDLETLRRAGIPVVSQSEHREALTERSGQRRAMLGLVRYSGWPWRHVVD